VAHERKARATRERYKLPSAKSGELAAELRALAAEAHKLGSEIDFVAGRLSWEAKGMSTPQRVDEEREKIRHEAERAQQRVDEEREKIGHEAERAQRRVDEEREKIGYEAERAQQRIDEEREKIRHEAERVHHKLVEPDYTLVRPDGKTLVNIKGRTQLTADEALHWCELIKRIP
jgi:DNA anti-recombination protein RmuC